MRHAYIFYPFGSHSIVVLLTMTVLKCFARRTRWCERGWSGFPALPCQALGGHWSCLEALLSKGCLEVDATEEHGWSPLALSALRGHSQCLRLLLQHGARTLARNPRTGSTALHVAGEGTCLEWGHISGWGLFRDTTRCYMTCRSTIPGCDISQYNIPDYDILGEDDPG